MTFVSHLRNKHENILSPLMGIKYIHTSIKPVKLYAYSLVYAIVSIHFTLVFTINDDKLNLDMSIFNV